MTISSLLKSLVSVMPEHGMAVAEFEVALSYPEAMRQAQIQSWRKTAWRRNAPGFVRFCSRLYS